ncbi:hypothetical protein LCGC14_0548990 [marine sediment metagenome]|uniref:LamG-like jellyroll fold domain-containing protein n=1 Tax=marine sediment metagenome TaxID=412755 RepID=A0A0F9UBS9_9ZZZZ
MALIKNANKIELHWLAGQAGLVGADSGAILLEDKDFELSGGSATDTDVTYDADQGLAFETAGAGVDQCVMLPQATGDNVSLWREIAWTTDNLPNYEAVIRTDALKALMEIEVGLVLTMPDPFDADTDADQCKFTYLQGTDTNWQVSVSVNNVNSTHDTGVPVVASSVYHFALRVDRARVARCYINDRLVAVTIPLKTGIDLLPTVGVQAGSAAAAVKIYVRELAISRELVA